MSKNFAAKQDLESLEKSIHSDLEEIIFAAQRKNKQDSDAAKEEIISSVFGKVTSFEDDFK